MDGCRRCDPPPPGAPRSLRAPRTGLGHWSGVRLPVEDALAQLGCSWLPDQCRPPRRVPDRRLRSEEPLGWAVLGDDAGGGSPGRRPTKPPVRPESGPPPSRAGGGLAGIRVTDRRGSGAIRLDRRRVQPYRAALREDPGDPPPPCRPPRDGDGAAEPHRGLGAAGVPRGDQRGRSHVLHRQPGDPSNLLRSAGWSRTCASATSRRTCPLGALARRGGRPERRPRTRSRGSEASGSPDPRRDPADPCARED